MMRRVGHYALAERSGYRAIRLPYEVGAIGMVVLLPNEINGLDAVTRGLDTSAWTALLADLRPGADKLVDLTLPRFKAHFGADLVAPFHAEGISRAFDLKLADFSGISGRPPAQVPLAIGAIVHRAVVDVMEDGTEAAAATAIAIVGAAAHQPPEMPVSLRVDHPFLFAIVDDATGVMLFLGRVNDPR
jgi:serpin B